MKKTAQFILLSACFYLSACKLPGTEKVSSGVTPEPKNPWSTQAALEAPQEKPSPIDPDAKVECTEFMKKTIEERKALVEEGEKLTLEILENRDQEKGTEYQKEDVQFSDCTVEKSGFARTLSDVLDPEKNKEPKDPKVLEKIKSECDALAGQFVKNKSIFAKMHFTIKEKNRSCEEPKVKAENLAIEFSDCQFEESVEKMKFAWIPNTLGCIYSYANDQTQEVLFFQLQEGLLKNEWIPSIGTDFISLPGASIEKDKAPALGIFSFVSPKDA